MRHSRLFGIGLVLTSALVLSTIYYMTGDVDGDQHAVFVERAETGVPLLDNLKHNGNVKISLNHVSKKLGTQEIRGTRDREQESLADDNPDLVFLRKFGRVKQLPTAEQMKNMSDKEIQYIYHSYLDNTDFSCKRKLRMGKTGDGGWEVCDDFRYRPIKPCVVYSFGINFDFSFDDDVGRVYGCTVHAFDPSMHKPTYRRSDRVFYYDLGISGKKANLGASMIKAGKRIHWNLKTLTQIKAMLRHQNTTLDIVKMDIEQAEWATLEDILQQGELSQIRQLLIEFHYNFQPATVRHVLPILQRLEASGLRRFHTHMNPYGPSNNGVFPVGRMPCYEIYFVNTNLMRVAE